jgi:protocatechuate 3,4-dioxygenase beta subunit
MKEHQKRSQIMIAASRFLPLPVVLLVMFPHPGPGAAVAQTRPPEGLPACEWCGAGEAPANLSWRTTIAPPDEPGRRIVVSGRVLKSDGRTPAPGVIIYAYHTNNGGIYARKGGETGNGLRHGRLRGWMRTDSLGRYEFRTIRPGGYPGGTEPAHIHMTVKEPGKEEYWIDSILFDDDPRLTRGERGRLENVGGAGVVTLKPGADGTPGAARDIILK